MICEFYPKEKDDPVCGCGSDISGPFICTKEYSLTCQWAIERRKKMNPEKLTDEKDLTGKTYGFYVAGVQHHDIYKVQNVLKEEDFLSMVLEPSNQYDPNAVRLEFRDIMIGYVPMKISADISALIMSDEGLWGCKIVELKWDEKSWKQVKVSIEEIN